MATSEERPFPLLISEMTLAKNKTVHLCQVCNEAKQRYFLNGIKIYDARGGMETDLFVDVRALIYIVAQLLGTVQDLYKKTRSLIYGDTYATEQIQGKVFLDILVLFMA